ncbi:anaphase promoting complex subunit 11 [Cryomyces antarcticus]
MKVIIKSYHAVASWRWDMPEDDLCGICRVQFDGTCPKCTFPGDDCPLSEFPLIISSSSMLRHGTLCDLMNGSVVMGECGHSFHMHCLDTWIHQESSQGKCPMCRQGIVPRLVLTSFASPVFSLLAFSSCILGLYSSPTQTLSGRCIRCTTNVGLPW